MQSKRIGAQTMRLSNPPSVLSFAAVGGKMEAKGPLAEYFDELSEDHFWGEKTWEKGESTMQKHALSRALEKGNLKPSELDAVFAGDLLNQCIGSSFSLREFGIPFYGLYGACSTMGEGLSLAALLIDGGFASRAAALTSSHFCTAERQYRMPVPYGSQRTPTSQWTATASGCCILADTGGGPYVTHVTTGKIVDKGITDANNMGAAMAPVNVKDKPYFFAKLFFSVIAIVSRVFLWVQQWGCNREEYTIIQHQLLLKLHFTAKSSVNSSDRGIIVPLSFCYADNVFLFTSIYSRTSA